MTQRGLIGAVLYAKDLARLTLFYSAVAEIELQSADEDAAILGVNPSQFCIIRIPSHIADRIEIATPQERRSNTPFKPVFGVASIALARVRAGEYGGAVSAAETEWQFAGATICDGYDPEGNVFQLREAC